MGCLSGFELERQTEMIFLEVYISILDSLREFQS